MTNEWQKVLYPEKRSKDSFRHFTIAIRCQETREEYSIHHEVTVKQLYEDFDGVRKELEQKFGVVAKRFDRTAPPAPAVRKEDDGQ